MQEFLRGVALAEFLQLFEELVCFVASLSQKLAEVVMSGFSKRLVGELGHLGVDDGVDPWPGEGHVHTADELLLGNAGEGIVDEPPQSSWPATLRVIGEERFDDLDVAIGGHAVSSRKILHAYVNCPFFGAGASFFAGSWVTKAMLISLSLPSVAL